MEHLLESLEMGLQLTLISVIIAYTKGIVELGKESGSLVSPIGSSDATNAKFSGNDLVVVTKKGKTELRKKNVTVLGIPKKLIPNYILIHTN